jgi:hypothetical protein
VKITEKYQTNVKQTKNGVEMESFKMIMNNVIQKIQNGKIEEMERDVVHLVKKNGVEMELFKNIYEKNVTEVSDVHPNVSWLMYHKHDVINISQEI